MACVPPAAIGSASANLYAIVAAVTIIIGVLLLLIGAPVVIIAIACRPHRVCKRWWS